MSSNASGVLGAAIASIDRMSGRTPSPSRASHPISHAVLVEAVLERAVPNREVAERVLHSTLTVLGQRLMDDEALALAACLPEELARPLEQSEYSEYDGDFDATEFYERVRRRERASRGASKEHVNVALQALGANLDETLRARLTRVLPKAIGDQLVPQHFGEAPPHVPASHVPELSTLAHGRPGSRHPIAEAAPPRGQTHSVARNDEPHAETKLSSSPGLTQERHRESLATGRPPEPERPVAEAKDE
jgi:uncharacterized protein (DUF2267 family)